MHWIEELTENQRKEMYERYEIICFRLLKLMILSFILVLFSIYLIVDKQNFIYLIISLFIHGCLGSFLIIFGNTIFAIKHNYSSNNNYYHKIGLYFGLIIIPWLLSYVVKEFIYIE